MSLGARPRTRVRPLFSLCIDLLTEYIDCVDSLEGVPETIRVGVHIRCEHVRA